MKVGSSLKSLLLVAIYFQHFLSRRAAMKDMESQKQGEDAPAEVAQS